MRGWFASLTPRFVSLASSLLVCFAILEVGYRTLDPFPFFRVDEINHTEHGNLTTYDETLGWKGVPGGMTEFVTKNNKVRLVHNRQGFRDIEHDEFSRTKPAIVFLGDSFTWGYEVGFDEMFVNRLRERLSGHTLVNLSHRGYGTDQSLLTFRRWRYEGPVEMVVLMFSENDVGDNNANLRNGKPKPMYQLVADKLVLTGIPVPKVDAWSDSEHTELRPVSWKQELKNRLFHSHFLHDIYFRYTVIRWRREYSLKRETNIRERDLLLTSRILRALKNEVQKRRSRLVVGFIPSQKEVEQMEKSPPYQPGFPFWPWHGRSIHPRCPEDHVFSC